MLVLSTLNASVAKIAGIIDPYLKSDFQNAASFMTH